MSNLLKRFLTAVIAGGVAVTAIVLSSWGSWVFGTVVSLLGLYEFYRMADLKSRNARGFMMGFAAIIWIYLAATTLFAIPVSISRFTLVIETNLLVVSLVFFGIAAMLLLFEKQVEAPALEMGTMAFGFLYAFLPLVLMFLLSLDPARMAENLNFQTMELVRDQNYNFRIPLGILMVSWGLDTAAYFGGRFIGGKKLFVRISPKKTWAGSISGAVAAVAVGFFLDAIWPLDISWVVIGSIIAVLGQMGDLVESMFKRGLMIKDSGGILPGHGGMLDRFDGLYISLPIIYLYYLVRFAIDFGSI
jgi:phosphatidate cytidylyltransferase